MKNKNLWFSQTGSFSVTDPFLTTFYYVEKLNGILSKNRRKGLEKSYYAYMGMGGGIKNCQNHAYVINEWLLNKLGYKSLVGTRYEVILCVRFKWIFKRVNKKGFELCIIWHQTDPSNIFPVCTAQIISMRHSNNDYIKQEYLINKSMTEARSIHI